MIRYSDFLKRYPEHAEELEERRCIKAAQDDITEREAAIGAIKCIARRYGIEIEDKE